MSTIFNYRSGTSFQRSPVIDGFIDFTDTLYERWQPEWPRESYQGGTIGITCANIKEVGYKSLAKIFGVARATELLAIAKQQDMD